MTTAGVEELPLDQNFPEPILRCLEAFILDVKLVPLRQIDPRLSTLDDRELIIALQQLGYSGLVTNNYKMLKNPRELAAILKTKLTVFAIEGVGDDPLRATGALLLDLPSALKRRTPGKAEVFWMRPRNPVPQKPWEIFEQVAGRLDRAATDLYKQVEVTEEEFERPVLQPPQP